MKSRYATSLQPCRLRLSWLIYWTVALQVPFTYCWSQSVVPKPDDWGDNIDVVSPVLEFRHASLLRFVFALPPEQMQCHQSTRTADLATSLHLHTVRRPSAAAQPSWLTSKSPSAWCSLLRVATFMFPVHSAGPLPSFCFPRLSPEMGCLCLVCRTSGKVKTACLP